MSEKTAQTSDKKAAIGKPRANDQQSKTNDQRALATNKIPAASVCHRTAKNRAMMSEK